VEFSGNDHARRRAANARALAAFGVSTRPESLRRYRQVRAGNACAIFTIGYERRDADDLISRLWDARVEVLVDVRDNPVSRKPDFRQEALRARCTDAGIQYQSCPELGSTRPQREALKETGDVRAFRKRFRAHVKRYRMDALHRLEQTARTSTIALLCYERVHEDCHRAVVADLLADRLNATVYAL
jgi:uncharacterized protein (DUF488 family)